jgi:hypothetical protein
VGEHSVDCAAVDWGVDPGPPDESACTCTPMTPTDPTPDIWAEVADELDRAVRKFGPMASGHEAVAVIEEEFLEFRSAVFWGVDQKGRPSIPRDEAIQIAAMAVRYILDVADR